MERAPFLGRRRSGSFSSTSTLGDEKHLPIFSPQRSNLRVRTLLGHCLYRRVILWTVAALALLCLMVSTTGVQLRHGRVLDFVDFGQRNGDPGTEDGEGITFVISSGVQDEPKGLNWQVDQDEEDQGNMPSWLWFKQ